MGATTEERIAAAGLDVDKELYDFVCEHVLTGLGVAAETVWEGLARLVRETGPRITEALQDRGRLQTQLDEWHRAHPWAAGDRAVYRAFLESIGYLLPEGEDFSIDTDRVDAEIATIAGPQLVVPISNARYALNAANARWGSLYDAVYGTDVLGTPAPAGAYDPVRGAQVIAWVRRFLDETFPLVAGSHADAQMYLIRDGELSILFSEGTTELRHPSALAGYAGDPMTPSSVLLSNHGLGVALMFDREHAVGRDDAAGISDVMLEAAVTVIIDFEDSVAAVDARDKVSVYSNWLGLMRGDLSASVTKDGRKFERRLEDNRAYIAGDGTEFAMRGRALLMARNVGHLMTTPAVLDEDGNEIPEGLLDALMTVLIAQHDFQREPGERNSPAGSVYIVKPKLHGPAEVALTDDIFTIVEEVLALPPNTVKLGIMDEERRTTVNLKECIRAARNRIAFINTGFLDRTGDEIHTSMEAGPMERKADMRSTQWIKAYEDWNVDTGLACGLQGRAQIGKGMWAAPDNMAEMIEQKIAHPEAGANCAWVPSPTAATLHATHYHRVDVHARQAELAERPARASVDELLAIPVVDAPAWTPEERRAEVDNNVQGILGYVVRWIDQGIGCSKVPDINDVQLMEDRATCRISSQHVANWLRHGIVSPEWVDESLRRMAIVVDEQNATDPAYEPLAPDFDGHAFLAARALIFEGTTQPSGYTEPILHSYRARRKASKGALA
jgi:malate synthase